jgi:hypothetical protein
MRTTNGNVVLSKVIFEQSGYIVLYGSSSIDTLILKENGNVSLTAGSILNVNKHFESINCAGFNTLTSSDFYTTSAKQLRMQTAGATVNADHLYINLAVTGTATPYTVYSSVNPGNFAGWNLSTQGRDLYWVGGKGSWNDPLHWANSSNGTPGSGCIPSISDNVFFDEGSGFTTSNDTVSLIGVAAYCKNMTWHNMDNLHKPVLHGRGTATNMTCILNIHGSLEFQKGMTVNIGFYNGSSSEYISMSANDSVTIKTNGVKINGFIGCNVFRFTGTGAYNILDDFTVLDGNVLFSSGRLYMNGITATMDNFTGSGSTLRALNIRNSKINIKSTTWNYSGSNFTLSAEGSHICMSGTNNTFTVSNTHVYDTIEFVKKGTLSAGAILNTLILAQGFDASNTFNFPANGTITINRKIIPSGTPCNMVNLTSSTTGTAATINVPLSAYNLDPVDSIGFELNFTNLSYLHITEGTDKAKVRVTNQSDVLVLGSLTGNWEILTPFTGADNVSLGNDTSMWCNATFPINTDHFYGDHNTKYLWNDSSTENHLIITDFGDYWVRVNYDENCQVIDTIHVTRDNDIHLTGTATKSGSFSKVTLALSGISSFDPNPVFVLDSVQPAGAITGLPLIQDSPDFYFSVPVRAFFSHTDSLSRCRDTCSILTSSVAVNDTALIMDDDTAIIALLDNDIYFLETGICTSVSTELSSLVTVQHGTAQLIHDTLRYYPNASFIGIDSLHYVLNTCGTKDTAAVYFIVVRDTFDGCPGKSITMELPDISGMVYNWYDAQTEGNNVMISNSYTVVKGGSYDIGKWWVEAIFGVSAFPRFQVTLVEGSASTAAHIAGFTGDMIIITGTSSTLTAHAVSEVINPVFEWYGEATGGTPFHTENSYTTSLLTEDTTFYVSVSGDNYCSSTERKAVTVHVITGLKAVDDLYSIYTNTTLVCDVLANDTMPDNCTPVISIEASASNGTVNVINGKIVYTPDPGFYDRDVITYKFSCGAVESYIVKVIVIVSKPLSNQYIACPNADVALGFYNISDIEYNWYNAPTGGDLIKSASDTIMVIKDNTPIQTWWAEPIYNSVVHPRLQVDLNLSDNCGVTTQLSDCMIDGTVIWKEDFGGNALSDPQRAPDPGWKTSGKTTYTYVTRTNPLLPDVGEYGLLKNANGGTATWAHNPDDHTTPTDENTGYYLTFDAQSSPGQFYEFEIEDICEKSNLTFSAWLLNMTPNSYYSASTCLYPRVSFVIEDSIGNALTTFYTGDVLATEAGSPLWVNYAFPFTVPTGIRKLRVRFVNNQTGSGTACNDISLDDLEVRFCSPPITITQPSTLNNMVCVGDSFSIAARYQDDNNALGSVLVYYWEYNSNINNPNGWSIISSPLSKPEDTINSVYTINPVTAADAGYYRMVLGGIGGIGNYNCRARSKIVHVEVGAMPTFTIKDTIACTIDLNHLVSNVSADAIIEFFVDTLATHPVQRNPVDIPFDTIFYARATNTITGCQTTRGIRVLTGIHTYPPDISTTAARSTICIGETIVLTNPSPIGGTWEISDPAVATLKNATTGGTVEVEGLTKGHAYVVYIMRNTYNCFTRVLFRIKVISNEPPKIIIGLER